MATAALTHLGSPPPFHASSRLARSTNAPLRNAGLFAGVCQGARLSNRWQQHVYTSPVCLSSAEQGLVDKVRESLGSRPETGKQGFYCSWSWDEACPGGDDAASTSASRKAPTRVLLGAAKARGKGKPSGPCQDFLTTFIKDAASPPDPRLVGLPHAALPLCVSGIFDGHGNGQEAPILAHEQIFDRIVHNRMLMETFWYHCASGELSEAEIQGVAAGFSSLFRALDQAILKHSYEYGHINGTTALVAVACGSKFYCSNLGDTRAVLCDGGQAVRISRDHTPGLEEERARIEGRGGRVVERNGVYRVLLASQHLAELAAVSRALGDRQFKDRGLIVSEPDISAFALKPHAHKFVISASDGLWCALSDQEAVDAVLTLLSDLEEQREVAASQGGTADAAPLDVAAIAASRLLKLAQERGSLDDISVVVHLFDWSTPQSLQELPPAPVSCSGSDPHLSPSTPLTPSTPPPAYPDTSLA